MSKEEEKAVLPATQMELKKPSLADSHATATIKVGDKEFSVHMDFICYHSRVCRAAFLGPFLESKSNYMEWQGTSPAIFRIFITWMYKDGFTKAQQNVKHAADMVDLWILADGLIVPRLKNEILMLMCGYPIKWIPSSKIIQTSYARTDDESILRRFMIKAFTRRCSSQEFSLMALGLPEKVMFDIAVFLRFEVDFLEDPDYKKLDAVEFLVSEA